MIFGFIIGSALSAFAYWYWFDVPAGAASVMGGGGFLIALTGWLLVLAARFIFRGRS